MFCAECRHEVHGEMLPLGARLPTGTCPGCERCARQAAGDRGSSRPPLGHAPGRAHPPHSPHAGRAAQQAGPRDGDEIPGALLRAGRRTAGAL